MVGIRKKAAMDALRRLKQRAHQLDFDDLDTVKFDTWQRDVEIAIEHIFGKESRNNKDFTEINYEPEEETWTTHDQKNDAFEEGMELAESTIQSMIDEIRQFWPEGESVADLSGRPQERDQVKAKPQGKRVFIVHGHDETMKEAVARMVTQLGLEPIILHEQPNKGRTIIEKFTNYADVSYAVVLLSPDDRAFPKDKSASQSRPRARQNVILELGYFLGQLGREHVFPLYRGDRDFEIPSDYSGVIYTQFDDAGAWKLRMVKELKACGFKVDANRLVSA